MIAKIACAALMGIDALKIELEVDFSRSGMPCFTMVGLAEGAVKGAKERQGFLFDFAEVKGQEHAKRAIEVATAGGHNLLTL